MNAPSDHRGVVLVPQPGITIKIEDEEEEDEDEGDMRELTDSERRIYESCLEKI